MIMHLSGLVPAHYRETGGRDDVCGRLDIERAVRSNAR